MSVRRVYRAIAHYEGYDVTRHFLTKRARNRWAQQRLEGYPEQPPLGPNDDGVPALEPALSVDVADSEPVVFP